jgi:hypothetical protein
VQVVECHRIYSLNLVLQATHGHGVQVNSNLLKGKLHSVSCGSSHSRAAWRVEAEGKRIELNEKSPNLESSLT